MTQNSDVNEKGETPMTDYQFEYVMKLKDQVAELTNELTASLGAAPPAAAVATPVQQTPPTPAAVGDKPETIGMTDYQFKQFEKLRDKLEALTRETNFLRMENATLKSEIKRLKKS